MAIRHARQLAGVAAHAGAAIIHVRCSAEVAIAVLCAGLQAGGSAYACAAIVHVGRSAPLAVAILHASGKPGVAPHAGRAVVHVGGAAPFTAAILHAGRNACVATSTDAAIVQGCRAAEVAVTILHAGNEAGVAAYAGTAVVNGCSAAEVAVAIGHTSGLAGGSAHACAAIIECSRAVVHACTIVAVAGAVDVKGIVVCAGIAIVTGLSGIIAAVGHIVTIRPNTTAVGIIRTVEGRAGWIVGDQAGRARPGGATEHTFAIPALARAVGLVGITVGVCVAVVAGCAGHGRAAHYTEAVLHGAACADAEAPCRGCREHPHPIVGVGCGAIIVREGTHARQQGAAASIIDFGPQVLCADSGEVDGDGR